MDVKRIAQVAVVFTIVSLAGCLSSLMLTHQLLILLLLRPKWFRETFDSTVCSVVVYLTALLELFLGIKIVITGDEIRHGERNLMIMNHRTRLDWMYLWSVLVRQSGVKTEKIILKAPLKYVPGAGWAMQSACLLFIKRKWEEDKLYLTKMLDYFAAIKYKTQILLFPEGTDLTKRTKASSDSFATKNNLPPLEYVLHPRTTGFNFIVQKMRDNQHLDAVYDISIAYPYNFPQNEPELLKGNFPQEVHFHIKRYQADSLPESDEDLGEWCKERWNEKEEVLKNFYTKDKHFPGEQIQDRCSGSRNIKATLWIAAIYWTVFVFGILMLLYYSSLARWVGIFQVVFHLYMGRRGGFELFQAELFSKWKGIAKKSS